MNSTEKRILSAAIELFGRRGFGATGIRELSESAGISTSALYHYMGTKESLLLRMMVRSLTCLMSAAERALDDATTCEERVAALVRVHVIVHGRYQRETIVVDNELRALGEDNRRQIVQLRDAYESLWKAAIDEGCDLGRFGVEDPKLARFALMEMCTGIAHWYSSSGPVGLQQLADCYVDMALRLLEGRGTRLTGTKTNQTSLASARAVELVESIWSSAGAEGLPEQFISSGEQFEDLGESAAVSAAEV